MNSSISWWSSFFTGLSSVIVSRIHSPKQTLAEADFIQKVLELQPGATVGDIPCGDGRLAIELAKRGYHTRGIDISGELIEAARRSANEAGLPLPFEVGDMKALSWKDELDGALCFGNSFAYFDENGNREFVAGLHRALRKGGKLILQTNVIAESILTRPLSRTWYELGDILFLHAASYQAETSSLISDYQFIRGDLVEKKQAIYRIYTVAAAFEMLRETGFQNLKAIGSLSGEPFKLGDPSLYIVAQKSS